MKTGDSASLTRRFTPEDLRGFAALAGIDPVSLAAIPEPLIAALFSYLLGVRLPGPGTNYLKQELDYLCPAPLDAVLTAMVTITRLRPDKHLCDLETVLAGAAGAIFARGRALVLVKDVGSTAS
ncbi:MAG: phosphate acetyltransferase [Hyphomicrobiales bacterium]|nr:phosphate acetyltransferase [Hyphomicrobiales bacterium]